MVKRYRKADRNAVDGISLEVEAGEFFALLGPNGAGKTTTISILTTTLAPTSGRVLIGGADVVTEPSTAATPEPPVSAAVPVTVTFLLVVPTVVGLVIVNVGAVVSVTSGAAKVPGLAHDDDSIPATLASQLSNRHRFVMSVVGDSGFFDLRFDSEIVHLAGDHREVGRRWCGQVSQENPD